jgi:hypothetical protein
MFLGYVTFAVLARVVYMDTLTSKSTPMGTVPSQFYQCAQQSGHELNKDIQVLLTHLSRLAQLKKQTTL